MSYFGGAVIVADANEKYILITGGFASGKSSVVNALVGENVIATSVVPQSSTITEIRYGDNIIIVYPRKGKNIGGYGYRPFTIPISGYPELFDAISGFNKANSQIFEADENDVYSCIEKLEIYVQSEFLKDGVVLVDTPGWWNTHDSDFIEYIQKSNMIIYTIPLTRAYSMADKENLDMLNQRGMKNIVFAYTFGEHIQDLDKDEKNKLKEYCIARGLEHTALGKPAIHFLSSRDGLQANIDGNNDLYLKSGYTQFSDYIKKVSQTQEKVFIFENERNDERMDKLSKHSKTMAKFKELIGKEKDCAKKIDKNQEQWIQTLDGAVKRTEEDFNVVVMGNFSAGKSTMINALIGEDVLPSYPMPTTAVMTELRYGESKKIIMYPKKGENIDGHGDKPFSVPATKEAIEQYVTIDNDAEINALDIDNEKITSKFEKMELYWPLEMLKNGVVIVDSPGLNDPYSNDIIVKEYLPKADAIIYTMNSTNAYQGTDKNELDSLNQYGIKNIIFACTYWDMICSQGEKTSEKTRTYCLSQTLKHTDLGSGSVHFLASRNGLHARIENDKDMLIESGYAEFEAFLQNYLTNHKGQDKVKNIVSTIETQAEQMKKHATILDENAKKDKKTIENNIISAKENLSTLKTHAESILANFKLKLETKRPSVEAKVLSAVVSLEDKVDLDSFRPSTELNKGIKKLKFWENNTLANEIGKEFQEEYARRIKTELTKCCSMTVSGEIQNAIKEAAENIEKDVIVLSKRLDALDNSIGLPEVDTDSSGTIKNILVGLVYGLITQNWLVSATTAAYGGLARQFGYNLAAGAAYLGIAQILCAPISLPLLALASIGGTIAAILSENSDKKIEKIRKNVLKEMKKAYFTEGESAFIEPTKNAIMKNVDEVFTQASDDIKAAIDITFAEKGKIFEAMLDQANLDSENKEQLIKERNDALAELGGIVAEAKQLQAEY